MPPRPPATAAAIALCLLPAVLAGCGDRTLADRLGMGKRSPDEFAIVRRAPLIVPPDYTLRPPEPGASGPGETSPREGARAALVGAQPAPGAAAPAAAGASAGQQALLGAAGADEADPRIRERIVAEADTVVEVDGTLLGRLFDWSEPVPGRVVDAAAEAERLRTARDAGLPPTAGETPMVVRRGQSPLEELADTVF